MGQNCVGLKKPPKKKKVIHIPFTLSEDSETLTLLRLIPIQKRLPFLKYFHAKRDVL